MVAIFGSLRGHVTSSRLRSNDGGAADELKRARLVLGQDRGSYRRSRITCPHFVVCREWQGERLVLRSLAHLSSTLNCFLPCWIYQGLGEVTSWTEGTFVAEVVCRVA